MIKQVILLWLRSKQVAKVGGEQVGVFPSCICLLSLPPHKESKQYLICVRYFLKIIAFEYIIHVIPFCLLHNHVKYTLCLGPLYRWAHGGFRHTVARLNSHAVKVAWQNPNLDRPLTVPVFICVLILTLVGDTQAAIRDMAWYQKTCQDLNSLEILLSGPWFSQSCLFQLFRKVLVFCGNTRTNYMEVYLDPQEGRCHVCSLSGMELLIPKSWFCDPTQGI